MTHRTIAAALAMAGALAGVGTAVGGETGSCSLEAAAAPVTVASAASATASSQAAEPVAATPPAPKAEKAEKPEQTAKAEKAQKAEKAVQPVAVATSEKATTRPRTAAKKPPHVTPSSDAAALAWWSPKVADALNLVYAGEASFSPAIVLLFDGDFEDPALANKVIHVTSDSGTPVAGQWVVATNKRMLLFKARPGRYQVKVGGDLVDGAGRKIAAAQGGPVTVATR